MAKQKVQDESGVESASVSKKGPISDREVLARKEALLAGDSGLTTDDAERIVMKEARDRNLGTKVRTFESPKRERENMVATRLPNEIYDKLGVMSASTGLSMSALTRLAVSELIMGFEARRGKPIEWSKATRDPVDQ